MTRDRRIERAAKQAATGFDGTQKRNIYQCDEDPSHLIVTVDLEPGVTPFTIACPICEAAGNEAAKDSRSFYRWPAMTSGFYVAHPRLVPTHEWYRPDTLDGLARGLADHVLKGGLLLRKSEP